MSLVEDIHHEGGSSCISLGGYDRWKGVSGVDNRLDDDLLACLKHQHSSTMKQHTRKTKQNRMQTNPPGGPENPPT